MHCVLVTHRGTHREGDSNKADHYELFLLLLLWLLWLFDLLCLDDDLSLTRLRVHKQGGEIHLKRLM